MGASRVWLRGAISVVHPAPFDLLRARVSCVCSAGDSQYASGLRDGVGRSRTMSRWWSILVTRRSDVPRGTAMPDRSPGPHRAPTSEARVGCGRGWRGQVGRDRRSQPHHSPRQSGGSAERSAVRSPGQGMDPIGTSWIRICIWFSVAGRTSRLERWVVAGNGPTTGQA